MQATGAYILYGKNRDGMLYTPEMSSRSRAIELWPTMKTLGRAEIEELVDMLCERAQQFALEIEQAGFTVLNEIHFNQVVVACESTEETEKNLKILQQVVNAGAAQEIGTTHLSFGSVFAPGQQQRKISAER